MHNYMDSFKITRDEATGDRQITCLGNTLVKHLSSFPTVDEIRSALAPLADAWSAPGPNGTTHPNKRILSRREFNLAARTLLSNAGFLKS